MLGTPKKICRKPSTLATSCILEPGAVMAINRFPASCAPTTFVVSTSTYYFSISPAAYSAPIISHHPQPLFFDASVPARVVTLPQPPNLLVLLPILKRSLDQTFQLLRQHVALGIKAHARTPAVLPVASSNCLNASAKSFTPSSTSFSVTSFMEMPAFSSEAITFAASSPFSSKLGRTRP